MLRISARIVEPVYNKWHLPSFKSNRSGYYPIWLMNKMNFIEIYSRPKIWLASIHDTLSRQQGWISRPIFLRKESTCVKCLQYWIGKAVLVASQWTNGHNAGRRFWAKAMEGKKKMYTIFWHSQNLRIYLFNVENIP